MKNVACPKCGAPLTERSKFCAQCGSSAVVAHPPTSLTGSSHPESDDSLLEWQAEMKLLTNRFFWGDMGKCLGLTLLALLSFTIPIFLSSGAQKGLQGAVIILSIPTVLVLFGTLIFIVIMGNRVPMEFKIDSAGVRMQSVSKRIKGINRAAIVLGLLAGKPGAVGAGELGRTQEKCCIAWNELHKVRYYPNQRVIFVNGGFLSKIRVYCTPENYSNVAGRIRAKTPPQAVVSTC